MWTQILFKKYQKMQGVDNCNEQLTFFYDELEIAESFHCVKTA